MDKKQKYFGQKNLKNRCYSEELGIVGEYKNSC
jgi:hypothetical protein